MPRASRRRGDAARRHADTIRFVLFEARPAGLTFVQLVRATSLTPSQVRSGLAALRDQIAEKGWPPLIWTREDGYQLGAERAALEKYERGVVKECLTVMRRFASATVGPHAAAHPGDKWARYLVAQLNSIESTLDLIDSTNHN
ncbi:RacP protein [Streptomyces sp. NPDC007920]|uniref:RacP protein n=1 Tax=Streptomyces sp. NPDC007920 TaxID=3364794 RepID=UPI0036E0F483